MILALNRSTIIATLVLAILLIVSILFALGVQTPLDLFKWSSRIVTLLTLIGILLNLTPVLRVVHKVTFGNKWWFPWLEGKWKAEIRSNWPKVERLYNAAKGAAPHFDALTAPATEDDAKVTWADVNIKVSLFELEIEIIPEGTNKCSTTDYVRPSWIKPRKPMLSYVYTQTDPETLAPTDTRKHSGAGIIDFMSNGELHGEYWTNRKGENGLNTSGTIIFRRIRSE